ncbi:MAG: site-2 protease family protein [Deltaproteobacteria bacterium]|nr:site-2 protease family protein [Deltaproteobacteria bacterium]
MTRRDALIHASLFVACCITTTIANGPVFAATLMGILTCHEFGHYIAGRRRGIDVSLPYFIPMPPVATFGTLGAVIRMGRGVEDRNKLFDVGASGPVAGMLAAVPLLAIGLSLSQVGPLKPDDMIEGNSILYALLKLAVFHRWLPSGGMDVQLHPMASAAWVGLLVTMINLIPIGQLDGGHIARAALGDAHETWSARLHKALPVIGIVVGGVMFAMALHAGRTPLSALNYAKDGLIPWMIWALLLGWMRRSAGEYHPPVSDVPLDPGRRRAAIAMLILFVAIVTPVPFRQVL